MCEKQSSPIATALMIRVVSQAIKIVVKKGATNPIEELVVIISLLAKRSKDSRARHEPGKKMYLLVVETRTYQWNLSGEAVAVVGRRSCRARTSASG